MLTVDGVEIPPDIEAQGAPAIMAYVARTQAAPPPPSAEPEQPAED